jgi:hypothetical protein
VHYEVVPIKDGMIGGHYAVQTSDGKIVGKEFGLDFQRASLLSLALHDAYSAGKKDSEGSGE